MPSSHDLKTLAFADLDILVMDPETKGNTAERHGRISSLVWLGFAILISIESFRLPLGSLYDPGPGFLPLGSGILLGLLSLANYFYSRQSKIQGAGEPLYQKERLGNSCLVLAVLFGYAIGLEFLGFLITTFLSLLILFRAIEPLKWIRALGGSAIATFISYAIFELWLKTQLPKGILGL